MEDEVGSIALVRALEVLDSRGRPTVEAEVVLSGGARGRAIAPSGASTGAHEAVELRDDDLHWYEGKGVRQAVANVGQIIAPALVGMEARDADSWLREHKDLGANATLAVSLAVAHALAAAASQPLWKTFDGERPCLPTPMVNLISGGLHAGRNLDLQDFLVIPAQCETYSQALERVVRIYNRCKRIIESRRLSALKADEGGFSPVLPSNEAALDLVVEAIGGDSAVIALDVAATHFYEDGKYRLVREGRTLTSVQMVELLDRWCYRYPIVSIEDGLAEDDWDGWRFLTSRLGARVQLIGDDLFTTNPRRVQRGIDSSVANAVLVKMNQIGTLAETVEVIELARKHNYRCVISARSGETEDTTMADLAVGTGAGQIKIGSVNQSERLAKYNQLLRIEREGLPYAQVY